MSPRRFQSKIKQKTLWNCRCSGKKLRPPFFQPLVDLLQSACLCHLGITLDDGKTLICLMNFTYVKEEETIILTTCRKAIKYQNNTTRSAGRGYENLILWHFTEMRVFFFGEDGKKMKLKQVQRHRDNLHSIYNQKRRCSVKSFGKFYKVV